MVFNGLDLTPLHDIVILLSGTVVGLGVLWKTVGRRMFDGTRAFVKSTVKVINYLERAR